MELFDPNCNQVGNEVCIWPKEGDRERKLERNSSYQDGGDLLRVAADRSTSVGFTPLISGRHTLKVFRSPYLLNVFFSLFFRLSSSNGSLDL